MPQTDRKWLFCRELSWDVMEPVSYFVSSAGGIFAYCYFLATHEDFGYAPWRDRIASNLQVQPCF